MTISGGTAPYQLTGSYNGSVDNAPQLVSDIPNHTPFTVSIVDANGCIASYTNNNLSPCVTLAVSLLNFSGHTVASGNQLNWATANENNNDLFTIEHATNGKDFVTIHNFKGTSNSETQQAYTFLHKNAPNGLNYYRLSQTDYDGTLSYLKTIIINRRTVNDFAVVDVYPSPVVDVLRADFTNPTQARIKVSIYNSNGQQIYDANYDAMEGLNTFSLNIENYPTGIYFLRLNNGTQLITQKFIK